MYGKQLRNTDRYINHPVHRVDDHTMSESQWDLLNVYGHEGHLEGCSHNEIQRLHFDPKVTPWSCRYPSGSTHRGSSAPIL